MDEKAEEREAFLQKYYHHLVRCIQPNLFYSWLRTKKVLSEDEQEEVDTKYHIRSLRAGYLIDLIMKKGEAGYVAFMECVEYLYPDLYKDLTGVEACSPPKEFNQPGGSIRRVGTDRARNSDTMCLMAKLLHNLTQDITQKNLELKKLKSLFDGVKEECKYDEDEKISLCAELELAREKNDELQSDKEELQKKLQIANAERDASKKQCEDLLVMKEGYFNQCNQLRQKLERMDSKVGEHHLEVRRERSVPFDIERLRRNQLIPQCENLSRLDSTGDSNVSDLKSLVAELEKKVDELTIENYDLREENGNLDERCEMLQENNDELQDNIRQIVAERDQYQKLNEDMKTQLVEYCKQKDELTAQCRTYHDRICTMSERMQYLDEEIDRLRLTDCGATSPTLRKNGYLRVPNLRNKRNGSYEALGINDPLVVFAPKEIESLLYKHLEKHFSVCEFSTFDKNSEQGARVAKSEDVLYWKKSATSYSFINKAWLQQKDKNTIVLSIPVHCVRIMKEKLKVDPIVVVIKYRSDSSISEYSYEEEVLSKPNAIKFAIVTVDEICKTNFTDLDAVSAVNELKKVVDMENRLRASS